MTYALEAVAIAVAVLGVFSTLLALVLERRREIGLLRVLGASAARVSRAVRYEAAALSALGIALGVFAGAAIGLDPHPRRQQAVVRLDDPDRRPVGLPRRGARPGRARHSRGRRPPRPPRRRNRRRRRPEGGIGVKRTLLALAFLASATPAPAADRFRPLDPKATVSFPRDHGAHDDARVEWWYVTGHLLRRRRAPLRLPADVLPDRRRGRGERDAHLLLRPARPPPRPLRPNGRGREDVPLLRADSPRRSRRRLRANDAPRRGERRAGGSPISAASSSSTRPTPPTAARRR